MFNIYHQSGAGGEKFISCTIMSVYGDYANGTGQNFYPYVIKFNMNNLFFDNKRIIRKAEFCCDAS